MSYLRKSDDHLYFLPLGGSGEIGMNLNLYGAAGRWLMVDLGMTFGHERYPGMDLIFPDTRFIEDEKDDLEAIVLTHPRPWLLPSIAFFAASASSFVA